MFTSHKSYECKVSGLKKSDTQQLVNAIMIHATTAPLCLWSSKHIAVANRHAESDQSRTPPPSVDRNLGVATAAARTCNRVICQKRLSRVDIGGPPVHVCHPRQTP